MFFFFFRRSANRRQKPDLFIYLFPGGFQTLVFHHRRILKEKGAAISSTAVVGAECPGSTHDQLFCHTRTKQVTSHKSQITNHKITTTSNNAQGTEAPTSHALGAVFTHGKGSRAQEQREAAPEKTLAIYLLSTGPPPTRERTCVAFSACSWSRMFRVWRPLPFLRGVYIYVMSPNVVSASTCARVLAVAMWWHTPPHACAKLRLGAPMITWPWSYTEYICFFRAWSTAVVFGSPFFFFHL